MSSTDSKGRVRLKHTDITSMFEPEIIEYKFDPAYRDAEGKVVPIKVYAPGTAMVSAWYDVLPSIDVYPTSGKRQHHD